MTDDRSDPERADDAERRKEADAPAQPRELTQKQRIIITASIATFLSAAVYLVETHPWRDDPEVSLEVVMKDAAFSPKRSTSALKAAAKRLVSMQLRDPDSAIFSDLDVRPSRAGSSIVCGAVNSRNGFGGMSGWQRFVAGGTVIVEEQVGRQMMDQIWSANC